MTNTPKRRTLHRHPAYFGAFLNIARHNAFMIMEHLSAKYDMEDKNTLDEAQLPNAKLFGCLKKRYGKPDVTEGVSRDLRRYFPFLNYPLFLHLKKQQNAEQAATYDINPEDIELTLKDFFRLLNQMRNNYSHYISNTDYGKFDKLPVQDIYEAAIFRLLDRGKHTKRFDVFESKHTKHLESNNSEYRPRSLANSTDHENTVAFVTCLFLERKYAFPFLSRLDYFRSSDDTAEGDPLIRRASHQCYTMFCCRLPQPKLESSDILLDMVNELGRCPSALYNLLSEEDQARFHIKREEVTGFEEDPDEELEQEIVLKRHSDRFPYFALRYFDDTEAFETLRFDVYLGKWRTKPVYKKRIYGEERERVLTQPIRTFTRLKQLLPIYENVKHDAVRENGEDGKLVTPDVTSQFHKSWIQIESDDRAFLSDRIEHFSPHYNFGDQVIGLKFINPDRHAAIQNVFPKLPGEEKKDKDAKLVNETADAIISTHEIRSLFLYHYLSRKPITTGEEKTFIQVDTETFIKQYIDTIKLFFEDVKSGKLQPIADPPDYQKNEPLPYVRGDKEKTQEERALYRERQKEMKERRKELNTLLQKRYGLFIQYIPSRLREYLLGYKKIPYEKLALQKLRDQRKEVKKRLKDIEKMRTPRVGEQATWLAEDIVFLTPPKMHTPEGKTTKHPQKLNNDQFRIMQSSLAYFSVNKEAIKQFFQKETGIGLSNRETSHPFLYKIDVGRCSGILDFYTGYLKYKMDWLDDAIKKVDNRKHGKKEAKKYEKYLPSSIRHKPPLKLDYTRLPVYLPRSLFKKAIVEALSAHADFQVEPEEDNVIFCLDQLLNGDTQDFYNWQRYYRSALTKEGADDELVPVKAYSDEMLDKVLKLKEKQRNKKVGKKAKQEIKDELRDAVRVKRQLLDREQYLRAVQAEDRALRLMIQDRQKQKAEHVEIAFDQLDLKNISDLLKKPIDARLRIPNTKVDITDQLPIRRYGDLRRVAKDRRLVNLAAYYYSAGLYKIPYNLVKEELEKYDRRREDFFEHIYQFEKEVYDRFAAELRNENPKGEGSYFSHWEYLAVAVKHSADTPFNEFFKEKVMQLRNKFHHNEFPYFDWLLSDVKKETAALYADRVFDVAEEYYERMRRLMR